MRIGRLFAAAIAFVALVAPARAEEVRLQIPVTFTVSLAPGSYYFQFVLYRTTNMNDPDAIAWMESMDLHGAKRALKTNKLTHSLGSIDPTGHPLWPYVFSEQLWAQAKYRKAGQWVACSPLVRLAVAPYAIWSAATSQPVCHPGDFVGCYDGAPGTAGKGPCKSGLRTCTAIGTWPSGCVGEVVPGEEFCNGADDDCNGIVDDNATCFSPEEVCREGDCVICAEIPEVCDGLDNNCNNQVDEPNPNLCPAGQICDPNGVCILP